MTFDCWFNQNKEILTSPPIEEQLKRAYQAGIENTMITIDSYGDVS